MLEYVDVTERLHVEAALRAAEERLRALIASAPVVLFAIDANGIFTLSEGRGLEILGLKPGQVVGQSAWDLYRDMPAIVENLRSASEVHKAAARGALLTRQLLTFSRKEVVAPNAFDVNLIVAEMENMLRRLIGEQIALTITLAGQPLRARCDRGQLEQVLLNLAVNARDAMPEGGPVSITVTEADVTEAECADYPGARPGPHVTLAVADEGCGMDEHTLGHLFEPFF